MLNLIKHAFIEQHFDYCSALCQKLLISLASMSGELGKGHCLLKVNAIRFRWLAKEQTMSYNKRSKEVDAEELANEYLEIYDKLNEASQMFDSGPLKDSKLAPLARGLCYFQHGIILEKVLQLYSPKNHTQKDLDHHVTLILEDFKHA